MEPTLEGALTRLFGREVAAPAPPVAPVPVPGEPVVAAPVTAGGPLNAGELAAAREALDASEAALRAGDWAGFDRERQRLREALSKLKAQSAGAAGK